MLKIEDTESLSKLLNAFRKNRDALLSNVPMFQTRLNEMIKRNCLYYVQNDDSLFVYADEGSYYELYYLAERNADLSKSKSDKEVLVNKATLKKDGKVALDNELLRNGFEIRSINTQYSIDVLENVENIRTVYSKCFDYIEKNAYKINYNNIDDREKVLFLWKNGLKNTDVPYSHFIEGNILSLVDSNNELLGGAWYSENGIKDSEWRHIVIDEKYRGHGLGTMMIYYYLNFLASKNVKRSYTWIEERNLPSIEMHKKVGFNPTNRVSIQYII